MKLLFDDLLPAKSFLSLDSDGALTLLATEKLIATETQKKIAHELDIAIEVYLIKHCNAIYYADLMSDISENYQQEQDNILTERLRKEQQN